MAGTINYNFDPNQEVYVIDTCEDPAILAVRKGVVLRVKANVLVTETTLIYDVKIDGGKGTFEFEETDVFADKPTAIADYQTRIE